MFISYEFRTPTRVKSSFSCVTLWSNYSVIQINYHWLLFGRKRKSTIFSSSCPDGKEIMILSAKVRMSCVINANWWEVGSRAEEGRGEENVRGGRDGGCVNRGNWARVKGVKDLQQRMGQGRNKDGGERGKEWGDERQTVRAEGC